MNGAPLDPFHLAFPVRDIEDTRAFYEGLLEATVGRSAERWIDFDFWGHQISAPRRGAHRGGCAILWMATMSAPFRRDFEWTRWHELAERLREADVRFVIEPHIRFEGQVGEQATMFFLDPSNNALEFKAFRNRDQMFTLMAVHALRVLREGRAASRMRQPSQFMRWETSLSMRTNAGRPFADHVTGGADDAVVVVDHDIFDGTILVLGAHGLKGARRVGVVADGQGDVVIGTEQLGHEGGCDAQSANRFARGVDGFDQGFDAWIHTAIRPSKAKVQRFFAAPKPPGKTSASRSSAETVATSVTGPRAMRAASMRTFRVSSVGSPVW